MSDYIRAGFDSKGPRDYLDERPITDGAILDLWEDAQWKRGQYRLTRNDVAHFTYSDRDADGDKRTIEIEYYTMIFRWPL